MDRSALNRDTRLAVLPVVAGGGVISDTLEEDLRVDSRTSLTIGDGLWVVSLLETLPRRGKDGESTIMLLNTTGSGVTCGTANGLFGCWKVLFKVEVKQWLLSVQEEEIHTEWEAGGEAEGLEMPVGGFLKVEGDGEGVGFDGLVFELLWDGVEWVSFTLGAGGGFLSITEPDSEGKDGRAACLWVALWARNLEAAGDGAEPDASELNADATKLEEDFEVELFLSVKLFSVDRLIPELSPFCEALSTVIPAFNNSIERLYSSLFSPSEALSPSSPPTSWPSFNFPRRTAVRSSDDFPCGKTDAPKEWEFVLVCDTFPWRSALNLDIPNFGGFTPRVASNGTS